MQRRIVFVFYRNIFHNKRYTLPVKTLNCRFQRFSLGHFKIFKRRLNNWLGLVSGNKILVKLTRQLLELIVIWANMPLTFNLTETYTVLHDIWSLEKKCISYACLSALHEYWYSLLLTASAKMLHETVRYCIKFNNSIKWLKTSLILNKSSKEWVQSITMPSKHLSRASVYCHGYPTHLVYP